MIREATLATKYCLIIRNLSEDKEKNKEIVVEKSLLLKSDQTKKEQSSMAVYFNKYNSVFFNKPFVILIMQVVSKKYKLIEVKA